MKPQLGARLGATLGCILVTALSIWTCLGASRFYWKAKAWGEPETWRESSCQVLSAGVSCADEDGVHPCDLNPHATFVPTGSPPVFGSDQLSVCPGTFWCARETELCRCSGEVIYAALLFNGQVYTPATVDNDYRVSTPSGTVRCGSDAHGQPLGDPAPGQTKYCWCTPQELSDLVQPSSTLQCSEATKKDFDAGRRLLDMGRRRRVVYSGWALVEVEQQKTCAYEYGLPSATNDEIYPARTNALAQEWGKQPMRDCWVRTAGASGDAFGTICSVALARPDSFKDASTNSKWFQIFWIILGSLGTVVCGIGAALACMAERDAAAAGPHVDESQGLVQLPRY